MNPAIKLLIKKKRIKQKQLAYELRISETYLSEILNNKKDPSYRVFMDMCKILKVCPFYLEGEWDNVFCNVCPKKCYDKNGEINFQLDKNVSQLC